MKNFNNSVTVSDGRTGRHVEVEDVPKWLYTEFQPLILNRLAVMAVELLRMQDAVFGVDGELGPCRRSGGSCRG